MLIIYERNGVFLHTSVTGGRPGEDVLISGCLRICRPRDDDVDGPYITWEPDPDEVEQKPPPPQSNGKVDHGWAVVDADAVSYKAGDSDADGGCDVTISHTANVNIHHSNGAVPARLHRINVSVKELKSIKQSNISFGWPYLIFILKDGTTLPALHFHNGGSRSMIRTLKSYLFIKPSATDSRLFLVHEMDPNALHKSFDELKIFDTTAPALVSKFFHDPYAATLGGFSKVTNFVRGNLLQDTAGYAESREDFAELLKQADIPALQTNDQEEPGYELITHAIELPPRKRTKRGQPLSTLQWTRHMDKDGRVIKVPELTETIFHGGIADSSIRIDVWKFLLGYYPWESSFKDRMKLREKKIADYFALKLQWKSIIPEQAKRFGLFRERQSLIEKDVNRTDRTHEFYQGMNNPNLGLLNDILMTYSMYNFDLGYVQGMSDLLAPILVIMENEVDSFWCFCGFMELVEKNFEMDQEGMKTQLAQLHSLVQLLDIELCNHLESHESSNMFFCFRWLLIMFKREFVFADVMRLWEVLWTAKPCKNFHLLICVAILDTEKAVLIENNFGFNEILKHINDICFQIDLDLTLSKAEAMYWQLAKCESLPRTICDIFGLPYKNTSPSQESVQSTPESNPNPSERPPAANGTKRERIVSSSSADNVALVGAASKNPIG